MRFFFYNQHINKVTPHFTFMRRALPHFFLATIRRFLTLEQFSTTEWPVLWMCVPHLQRHGPLKNGPHCRSHNGRLLNQRHAAHASSTLFSRPVPHAAISCSYMSESSCREPGFSALRLLFEYSRGPSTPYVKPRWPCFGASRLSGWPNV